MSDASHSTVLYKTPIQFLEKNITVNKRMWTDVERPVETEKEHILWKSTFTKREAYLIELNYWLCKTSLYHLLYLVLLWFLSYYSFSCNFSISRFTRHIAYTLQFPKFLLLRWGWTILRELIGHQESTWTSSRVTGFPWGHTFVWLHPATLAGTLFQIFIQFKLN